MNIQYEDLIPEIEARNREDRQRASSAGESRQKIGAFLEDTGLNSQAFSWMRTICKKLDKDEGDLKAMDIIASLEAMLPIVKDYVQNNGTRPMDLPNPADEPMPGDERVVRFS